MFLRIEHYRVEKKIKNLFRREEKLAFQSLLNVTTLLKSKPCNLTVIRRFDSAQQSQEPSHEPDLCDMGEAQSRQESCDQGM